MYARRALGQLQQFTAEHSQLLLGLAVLEARQPDLILNQLVTQVVLVFEQLRHELQRSCSRLRREALREQRVKVVLFSEGVVLALQFLVLDGLDADLVFQLFCLQADQVFLLLYRFDEVLVDATQYFGDVCEEARAQVVASWR